jgi:hypothetical protein
MSSTTVSSINQYILSYKGIVVPPVPYLLKQSNMVFPDSFTNMTTMFTNLHTDDARITFSSGMSGTAWRDVANGYELLCSSYNNWQGGDEEYIHDMFDSSGGTTFWYVSHPSSSWTYKLDGINQGKYTQGSYNSGGAYIGGGTGYYWTTTYNTGSVSGDWFQIKFPFKALFKGMDLMARTNALPRCAKAVRVLGSNDGTTWYFLVNLTYTTFTSNVWQSKTGTASDKFFYIRIVVLSTIGDANLNIGSCRITYDVYAP